VIHVTDGAYVYMRLTTGKFFFGHENILLTINITTTGAHNRI
jgi:hypothetical protein